MKPVILFALLLIGSVTLAQKSKTAVKTVKQKTYKPTDMVPKTGRPYFDTIINGEYKHLRRWEVLGDTAHDNAAMRYAAKLCFEELNARRKKMGKAPLIWDERLKSAAEHHGYYLDYVFFHQIDPDKDGWYMTHDEDYDIPNFEEFNFRYDKQDYINSKYPAAVEDIGECLAMSLSLNLTYDQFSKSIIDSFNGSKSHWEHLTDTTWKKWDAVYIYISPNNGVATVITARYPKR
jgi:uncharacterized protein YkwD